MKKNSIPSNTSVNRSPLAEGIHDLLRAIGLRRDNGLLGAQCNGERQGSGCATGERGELVAGGLNRVSPELAGLRFSDGCRIINLGTGVGRKSLKSSNGLEILLVTAEVRSRTVVVVVVVVVVDVRQRRVLRLRLAVGVTHNSGGVAEKILQLRRRVADALRRRFNETHVAVVQILLKLEAPVPPPCTTKPTV